MASYIDFQLALVHLCLILLRIQAGTEQISRRCVHTLGLSGSSCSHTHDTADSRSTTLFPMLSYDFFEWKVAYRCRWNMCTLNSGKRLLPCRARLVQRRKVPVSWPVGSPGLSVYLFLDAAIMQALVQQMGTLPHGVQPDAWCMPTPCCIGTVQMMQGDSGERHSETIMFPS